MVVYTPAGPTIWHFTVFLTLSLHKGRLSVVEDESGKNLATALAKADVQLRFGMVSEPGDLDLVAILQEAPCLGFFLQAEDIRETSQVAP